MLLRGTYHEEPITLLLDENLVVRQFFIGGIGERPLGRAIERLLQAIKKRGEIGTTETRSLMLPDHALLT